MQVERRLSDCVSLALLTQVFPPELVDRVLARSGRTELRRRQLPARLVVYFVFSLALFAPEPYEEAMRKLLAALAWSGSRRMLTVPTKAALFKARTRLGARPLRELFGAVAGPFATRETAGAFHRDWRLMSIGTGWVDVADTPANAAAFGHGTDRTDGSGCSPRLRLVGVAEHGTNALVDVAIGSPVTAAGSLVDEIVTSLGPRTLLVAGSGSGDYPLWTLTRTAEAELLWFVEGAGALPVTRRLADGSYLARVHRTADGHGVPAGVSVRVVDLPGAGPAGRTGRLVTTILDPARSSARELAEVYARRWRFDAALAELSVQPASPRLELRSRIPDGVIQEMWAYLCLHYAIRRSVRAVAK